MGAYLSEPLTTKHSSNEANTLLASGSSSMQGWRISQEDAHNCILNFDANTSFFAVYDGHGGSEVAQYCSIHLPTFLKGLSAYKAKQFEQALKDAFIGFDATLLKEKVIEELKKLSDKSNCEDEAIEEDEEEDEDDNVDDLCKEARMPLNEVLQMYKKDKKNPAISKIKEGNCSKPASPFLKGKRKDLMPVPGEEAGPSSSNAAGSLSAEADASSSKDASTPDAADSTVSSSSTKTGNSEVPESSSDEKKAEQSDEISDTDAKVVKQECAPDSSSSLKVDEEGKDTKPDADPVVNGESAGKSHPSHRLRLRPRRMGSSQVAAVALVQVLPPWTAHRPALRHPLRLGDRRDAKPRTDPLPIQWTTRTTMTPKPTRSSRRWRTPTKPRAPRKARRIRIVRKAAKRKKKTTVMRAITMKKIT